MSKTLNLKSLVFGLVASTIVGCSTSNDNILPALDQAASNTVSSLATSNLPLFVTFNNTYKMLAADNNATALKDPKNPDKYFIGLIDSATQTIDGAFYDMDDLGIADAFVRAKARGVAVRIITDTDNVTDKDDPTKPRPTVQKIRDAGIEVKEDHRSAIMHHKFMVVDNKTVWTGSMNLTTTSMYEHNNNSLKLESPELAADYNAEFKRMFEQGMFGPNPHEIPNPEVKVGDASVRLYFSPKGGTKQAVIAELTKATKSIKFMTFSLTDPQTRDLIIAKKNAGLKVEGVMDECLSRGAYSLFKPFKSAGVYVLKDGNQALLHHKIIIIDDETVITGSYNYSDSAENGNNENTIIVKSKTVANTYLKELARVKNAALTHKNIPSYDNPACGSGSPAKQKTAQE